MFDDWVLSGQAELAQRRNFIESTEQVMINLIYQDSSVDISAHVT